MEHLDSILLRGDQAALKRMAGAENQALLRRRDALLTEATREHLAGRLPFCQLTAIAQAAEALYNGSLPPVACCGAVAGNTSAISRAYMLMLLRAWGMPVLDLGTDVSVDVFLQAIQQNKLQFAVCAVFSAVDAEFVRRLHAEAVRQELRGQFRLLACGASLEHETLPLDTQETRTAAAAEWMVRAWKG